MSEAALVLIVLSPDRYPAAHRIGRDSLTYSFAVGDEQFTEITNDDFFGFYDWLRPEKGKIIQKLQRYFQWEFEDMEWHEPG